MSTWSDVISVDGEYVNAIWHPSFPLLAASTDGRIDFFSEDGRKIDKATVKKDGLKTNLLAWHPLRKILASSWSSGTLLVWSDFEQNYREAIGHHSQITCITWNSTGNRLVTGDSDGEVIVWRCDGRGRLTSICQYRLKSMITHTVFRAEPRDEGGLKPVESRSFFSATAQGSVFYADDLGHCSEDVKISSSILSMMMLETSDTLVIVNEDLLLSQYVIHAGKISLQTEFKLSASKVDKKSIQIGWVGPGVLAMGSLGRSIKMWDLITDESYNLVNPESDNSRLVKFAYNTHKNIISAATDSGYFLLWKKRWTVDSNERTVSWELVVRISIMLNVIHLQWGCNGSIVVAITPTGLTFFAEQSLCFKLYGKTAAVQIASNKIMLQRSPNYRIVELGKMMRIKCLAMSNTHIAVSNGHVIEMFEYSSNCQTVDAIGTICTPSSFVCLDSHSLIIGTPHKVNLCNYQGTIKQNIKIDESEGELTHLHSTDVCLLMATSKFVVKLFDLSRRDPKLIVSRKFEDFISLLSVQLNSCGNFISMFAVVNDKTRPGTQTQMLLYNLDNDKIIPVNFGSSNITPVNQNWDTVDSRILVCEVEGFITRRSSDPDSFEISTPYKEVLTMFATHEEGLVIQDRKVVSDMGDTLIGVSMPFHFYLRKTLPKDLKHLSEDAIIEKRTVRDFEGMEDSDPNTIKASIDFTFHLCMGNMDEAFKCIHAIRNKSIWEHMAKICVKTKRLDVAMTCLSNIGSSHAIRALREASKEPEFDVQVAILAAHLGMISEAEQLLAGCNRYDVLNRLYQASGHWDKSLEVCGSKDRINLRTTYHKFAKYLQEIGDMNGSLAAFEKSSSYSFEIPRMLLTMNGELEKYISSSSDKTLKKWWAQFLESRGDYKTALKFYEEAGDILSTVRVHCYTGNVEQAIHITKRTKNTAAAYHIARQYENDKKISEAISFYTTAKCFNHAVRLAKEYNMETELIHLALQGSKSSMYEVASYYEKIPKNHDKAIHLFFKAGSVSRAVDLCFQTRQFGILADLTDQLQKDTDPKLLKKCAVYFYENENFDKAVNLLIKAGENSEALDICIQKNVIITEEMANEMSKSNESDHGNVISKSILLRIADCCLQQRSFLLSCKKYTQAGERIKAMKALLQSGDTEKIIFFANALGSKQKEIFVMVANYLQTLDWRNDPSVTKAIIAFYTKAKSVESLASFYEACGQLEIDEYQNYEKGLSAFKEAEKCLIKSKSPAETEIKFRLLKHKIELVQKFVEARTIAKGDPTSGQWTDICEKLLKDPEIDDAVKPGDIYAMMIENKYATGSTEQASSLFQRMKRKVSTSNIDYFLDSRIVKVLDHDVPLKNESDTIAEEIP